MRCFILPMHRSRSLLPTPSSRLIFRAGVQRAGVLRAGYLSAALITAGVATVGLAPARAGDNMMDQMVRSFCLQAVNKEVADSGKPAPTGMPAYTCDCVVQQLKLKQSLDGAKAICKAKAAEKYSL